MEREREKKKNQQNSHTTLKVKDKIGGLIPPNIKSYSKATMNKESDIGEEN